MPHYTVRDAIDLHCQYCDRTTRVWDAQAVSKFMGHKCVDGCATTPRDGRVHASYPEPTGTKFFYYRGV